MKKKISLILILMAALLSACAAPAAAPSPQQASPAVLPTANPTDPPTPTEVPGVDVSAVQGVVWQWTSIETPNGSQTIDKPESYTLEFKEDGRIAIKADCNRAIARYTIEGQSLMVMVGPMTLAKCPDGSMSNDFVKYLNQSAVVFLKNGNLGIDMIADSGTLLFSKSSARADIISSLGLELDAEPYTAELFLGGGASKWLNPALVAAVGGTGEESMVDVSTLSPECSGQISVRPDVIVNWEDQEDVDLLRFFFLSNGDTDMVLVTPSGNLMCSDDLNPLVLDPYIEVENPEPGRYAIFIGTYGERAFFPGFFVVTNYDYNPATFDIARLFTRQVDPRGVPQPVGLEVLDIENADTPSGGSLATLAEPLTVALTAGGDLGAYDLVQPNKACTGFITAAPTYRFEWTGESTPLAMYFEADMDTTLVIQGPDGTFYCDDDTLGAQNINPSVVFDIAAGVYNVWVGSFAPDVFVEGNLTINGDASALPTALEFKNQK